MALADNIDYAVKRAGEYLASRNAAKLTALTSHPVAPGSPAEADLVERLRSAHDEEMDAKQAAVSALKALPDEMERAGVDSTCVLRLLHFIDGGGGPDRTYGEWTETKTFLQRAAIQIRKSAEPDDTVFFQRLLDAPSPPRLSATEMARLGAYLKRPVSMSMMQRAARADPAAVRERDRRCRLKEIRNFNNALREQEAVATPGEMAGGPSEEDRRHVGARPCPTRDEYNVLARAYLKEHPLAKCRELAKAIGCALGTVSKLPAWQAVMGERRKGRTPKSVSFTEKVEATVGKEDAQLQRLMADQEADRRETGQGYEDDDDAPPHRFSPRRKA